ncbi:MAG: metal-dependent transcriptional regulator [Lachnospiraceae bacterium]|nr:metal-dependent transcriptional regulator [Lachnospiraceae bacterium]
MNHLQHRSNESIEDYLETILSLQKKLGQVRSIDIANEMNFSKPSVSVAMKNLREKGFITTDNSGHILLTESGKKQAEDVLEKHTILTNWLVSLGVDKEIAQEDACRMEHDMSDETFMALKTHILS